MSYATPVARVCEACGAASAWDARYCQQCGRPLEDDTKTPRYYGTLSPGPAFVLTCVLLVAGLVALAMGSLLVTIVLLALALVSFVFFYGAARRKPDDPVARRVFASGRRLRGWAALAWASISAWVRALRDVVRLRRASRSLRRKREPVLRSLGDAAYRADEPAVNALRDRVREIDDELAKREAARAEAVAAARRHIDETRKAARSTQRFSVDETAPSGKVRE